MARYGASPSQTRADRDLPIEVEAILRRLPVRSRLLLELTAQGYTQREVAARLGCSIKIVGALVGRARRRARALRDRSESDG